MSGNVAADSYFTVRNFAVGHYFVGLRRKFLRQFLRRGCVGIFSVNFSVGGCFAVGYFVVSTVLML